MPRAPLNPPWTAEELEGLKDVLMKGKSLAAIAVRFRRSQAGILNKLRELNLPTPNTLKQRAAAGRGS
jgi:hypothetical protein